MTDVKALLQKANSSRIQHAYDALLDIKKCFMASENDVQSLINGKLVQRILGLLKTRDTLKDQYKVGVVDTSVSILSDLCMKEAARKVVLKENGVQILVTLFEEVKPQKIQIRVCRCLSNLMLDPGSWKFICCHPVIKKIVKLLDDSDETECKRTCIRAIRLLGQTPPNVDKLLEINALDAVLKLVDSNTDPLSQSAKDCVQSLGKHGCSAQFASQLIASGKLQYLLQLVKQKNHPYFKLITALLKQPNFLNDFGDSDGILIFHDLLLSEDSDIDSWKTDLLNGLCLCCQEVANRVKLREAGVLPSFLHFLEQDRYGTVHTGIINALICFLYDEPSFAVLLDNRLVPILVKHLEKTFTEFHGTDNSSHRTRACVDNGSEKKVESKAAGPANPDSDSIRYTFFGEEPEDDSESSWLDANRKPVYSLDSPTYKTVENWALDNMMEAQCIQSFTPSRMPDHTGRSSYSLSSNSSYYSSVSNLPEFSSPSSPCSSPETFGSEQKDGTSKGTLGASQGVYGSYLSLGSQNLYPKYPKYTGISCQLYNATETSDGVLQRKSSENNFSEMPIDPFNPENVSNTSLKAINSSKAEEDNKCNLPNQHPENTRNVDVEKKKDRNVKFCSIEKSSLITEKVCEEYKKKLENIKCTLKKDNQKTNGRKFKSGFADDNILKLLNKVSLMTNPTDSLVNREVITCLLNYMSKMEAPLLICHSLLSRVFRNPLCFEGVLDLGVPSLIYQKLLKKENMPVLEKGVKSDAETKHVQTSYSKFEVESFDSAGEVRFSTTSENLLEEKRRLSLISEDTSVSRLSREKSGLAFLEDLNGVADSKYGRGTVDRMLHSADVAKMLDIATNMLFVAWTQSSRNHYMYQRGMLGTILDALQPSPAFTEEKFVSVVTGIRSLAQAIDTRTKFQESIKADMILTSTGDNLDFQKDESELVPRKEIDNPCSSCTLKHNFTDLIFQIEEHMIPASRNLLSSKSEIFSAMLEGKFLEAQLKVIRMPETCKEAFECLVHYLHGCRLNLCDTIKMLFSEVISDETAANCVELLNECDKYNICDLAQHTYQFLCNNCITPSTSFLIFRYAVLHTDEKLMKACVSCLLCDTGTLEESVSLLCQCLSSEYANSFCQTVSDILLD